MNQVRAYLDQFLQQLRSASDDPLSEWVELIHHAAIYSEFLNIVPEAEESIRSDITQSLRNLHGSSFDVVTIDAAADMSWQFVLQGFSAGLLQECDIDDPVALGDLILDQARSRYASGGVLLVAVNDCHLLDQEVLNQIAHFSLLSQRYISFVLLGASGFAECIRESPAHSMKQYIANPDHDSVKAVRHDRVQDRVSGSITGIGDGLQKRFPVLKSIMSPLEGGGFPLGHTIVVTILLVVIVSAFLFVPDRTERPAAMPNPIAETTLPPPSSPAQVEYEEPALVEPSIYVDSESQELALANVKPSIEEPVSSLPSDIRELNEKPRTFPQGAINADSYFSIQLLGVGEEKAAIKFINRWEHDVVFPLGYLRTTLKDRPWYVVLSGRFATRTSAKQHINELPLELRQSKPWVRFTEVAVNWTDD